MAQRRVLYCHCAYANVVPKAVKEEVLGRLAESEVPYDAVPDLCELSAKRDPALQQIAAQGDVTIVACYPRAVRWLFAAADAPLPPEGVQILNMRTDSAETIVAQITNPEPSAAARQETP